MTMINQKHRVRSLREFLATPAEYCEECDRILNRYGECPDPGCEGSVPRR